MSPANKERFIYSASCVAVAAKITAADALEGAWAAVALPMIGGQVTQRVNGPAHSILRFGSAAASVNGFQRDGDYITENKVTVTELNVLNRVTAKSIEVGLTFTHNASTGLDVNVAVEYRDLMIDGNDFSKVVLLQPDLPKLAGANHGKFRQQDLPNRRKPNEFHKHQKLDTVFTSLADPKPNILKFENKEYGFLDFAGLGRIFFAEWAEEEDWQGIVGLRIALESANPQASGQIVIGDWLGNNGQFYP